MPAADVVRAPSQLEGIPKAPSPACFVTDGNVESLTVKSLSFFRLRSSHRVEHNSLRSGSRNSKNQHEAGRHTISLPPWTILGAPRPSLRRARR
jgi:hypothetical protein